MGVDIYLSINNSEKVMHIPVTPPKISITSAQGTETFETAGYGWVKIIAARELQGVSWESFFPVHDYPFRRDNSMQGQEYADELNSWRDRKLPIRLVITASGYAVLDINMACVIETLDGSVGTSGDYDYSISLSEVDLLNYERNDEEELTLAQYEEIMAQLNSIMERLNNVEGAMIYNWMDDNMPEWAKPTIQKLLDKGYLNGTGDNELGLTMSLIRAMVILDNAGVFDNVEGAMIYNWMDDNMPEWAKPTIQKLLDKGYLNGTGDNELGLTMSTIRALVILDNAGAFD